METSRSESAAAMCIGPLSTVIMKLAARMSRMSCRSVVWPHRSTQFSGASIRSFDLPTTTTRVGEQDRQNSSTTALLSDFPRPRANGCKRMNGG